MIPMWTLEMKRNPRLPCSRLKKPVSLLYKSKVFPRAASFNLLYHISISVQQSWIRFCIASTRSLERPPLCHHIPPATSLPPQFQKFEYLVSNPPLHEAISSLEIRTKVDKLPNCPPEFFDVLSVAEKRRLMVILAFAAHGYIWGNGDQILDRLPPKSQNLSIFSAKNWARYLWAPTRPQYSGTPV